MTSPRIPVDVLLVSLGSTFGLRASDDQLAELLQDCGLRVHVARAKPSRAVRTLALTDFVQARACAAAARAALLTHDPHTIIYSSTTAALLWPAPGVLRFDALAQHTRPGRHGVWQRTLERRRLQQATAHLPYAAASYAGAAFGSPPAITVPIAIEGATHDRATHDAVSAVLQPFAGRAMRAAAITYAADPVKKGLDRIVGAWQSVRADGETLLVAGHGALPREVADADGILDVGRLPRDVFRALVRAVGVYVTAPRREDYGLVQLEALAEGARVVTSAAAGPYAALPLVRELWPQQVVEDGDDLVALGRAIRAALDAPANPAEQLRAVQAVAPWSREAVRATLRAEVVPLLRGAAPHPR